MCVPKIRFGIDGGERRDKLGRDATIIRMLATPPKPHSEMKVGKRGGLEA